MRPNILGSNKYQQSYKRLNILQSRHIEIEKLLIINYLLTYKGTMTNYDNNEKNGQKHIVFIFFSNSNGMDKDCMNVSLHGN